MLSQLSPPALPGQRYGSFVGKALANRAATHLMPFGVSGQRYAEFTAKHAVEHSARTHLSPLAIPSRRHTFGAKEAGVVAFVPVIQRFPLNLFRTLCFQSWYFQDRYDRWQTIVVLTPTENKVRFHLADFFNGGAQVAMGGTYQLVSAVPGDDPFVDGVVNATLEIPAGTMVGEFAVDLSVLSEGWHVFIVTGPNATPAPLPMYVKHSAGQVPPQELMPVCTGSYDVTANGIPEHIISWLPTTFAPPAQPLAPRECPEFSTAVSRTTLFRTNLVPHRDDANINRPNVNKDGIWTTFNMQWYYWPRLVDKLPSMPLLDGPRGVGTAGFVTHIMVDRHGGAYCIDPWRVFRVSVDGTVKTRAGYRHNQPPPYWGNRAPNLSPGVPPTPELVGDWSAIPEERRGFHEMWGGGWDQESLELDPNAPPQGGEQPHATGPRLFVADTQNNRICLLTFVRDSFTAEPVITEFLTGLSDPWDVACVGQELFVSEREAHRIAAYDKDTGAFLRVVVQGADLAHVDVNRKIVRDASLTTIRAQPVVLPEGLFYQDGWLYYASAAMGEVRKVNFDTGEVVLVCRPANFDLQKSNFIKIALSDGTFGPRGTVFVWSWTADGFGFPQAWLPDTPGANGTNSSSWQLLNNGRLSCGRGGKWSPTAYGTAGAVGKGRLYCSFSEEGLVFLSKALATDPTPDYVKFAAGERAYWDKGYRLLYGANGFGFQGLDLPWGEDPNIDYYLTWNGHVQ